MTDKKAMCQKLSGIFLASVKHLWGDEYSVHDANRMTGLALVEAAAALGCEPDQLFIKGEESGGGCETCGYGSDSWIEISVKR